MIHTTTGGVLALAAGANGVDMLLAGLLIFALRITDMSLDTLRILSMVKGHRIRASLLGAAEAGIFIFAISQVLAPPVHWLQMLGYACGFGVGTLSGSLLADHFIARFILMRIISRDHGEELAEALREKGCRVTAVTGEGRMGPVDILFTVMERRLAHRSMAIVSAIDPKAFITLEPIEHARGGFVPRLERWLPSVRR